MENNTVKVLAIDDIHDNLITIKALICEAFPDAVVQTAHSGEVGIALARTFDPDVILLDIIMPHMDGFAVCQALKEDASLCDIPVVFVTALKGDTENHVRALEVGAEGFLNKPIDESELQAQIKAMVKIKVGHLQEKNEKERLEALVQSRTARLELELVQRRQTEEALLKSKQRYWHLFNSGNDAIFVHPLTDGKPGVFIEVNDVACSLLGYTRAELLTMAPADLTKTEYQSNEKLMEAGYAVFEKIFISKSGCRIPTEISSRMFLDEGVTYVLSNARDITERKKSDVIIQKFSERLELTMVAAKMAWWEMDISTGNVMFDKRKAAMIGHEPEKFRHYTDFMALVHPDDFNNTMKAMKGHFDGIYDRYETEYRILTKAGHYKWFYDIGSIIEKDSNGAPLKVAGIVLDITDRKQTQENLLVMESRLRQSEKMEAIGTLAGGIAHDFNNVLGGIIGYTDMSLDLVEKGSVLERNLSNVLAASDRAKHLVQQILTFSRRGNQQKSVIAMRPIVKEVMDLLKASIPSTVTIESDLHKDTKLVFADPTKIHEMLLNLATNAVYAMQRKGTLTVRLYAATVDNEAYGRAGKIIPGEYTVVEVADTGCGMDAQTLEKAFEPFYTTKPVGEGTGMGLSVVLGVVQQNGGDLQVESVPGTGTTFRIFLPVTGEEKSSDMLESSDCPGGTERILFVDDETILVDMASELLSDLGYTVTGMSSSPKALAYFREHNAEIDLLITDQTMPGMTGSELARAVLDIKKDLPVIICTGFSSDVTLENAASLGISRFAMKPLHRKDLANIVREVLDMKHKA